MVSKMIKWQLQHYFYTAGSRWNQLKIPHNIKKSEVFPMKGLFNTETQTKFLFIYLVTIGVAGLGGLSLVILAFILPRFNRSLATLLASLGIVVLFLAIVLILLGLNFFFFLVILLNKKHNQGLKEQERIQFMTQYNQKVRSRSDYHQLPEKFSCTQRLKIFELWFVPLIVFMLFFGILLPLQQFVSNLEEFSATGSIVSLLVAITVGMFIQFTLLFLGSSVYSFLHVHVKTVTVPLLVTPSPFSGEVLAEVPDVKLSISRKGEEHNDSLLGTIAIGTNFISFSGYRAELPNNNAFTKSFSLLAVTKVTQEYYDSEILFLWNGERPHKIGWKDESSKDSYGVMFASYEICEDIWNLIIQSLVDLHQTYLSPTYY